MPINFPNSPSPNQQYTYDNKTWEWNGIYWEVYSALTSYITSAYTVGDGYSDISGISNGNIKLKSFSGINITIIDGGDKLTFSGTSSVSGGSGSSGSSGNSGSSGTSGISGSSGTSGISGINGTSGTSGISGSSGTSSSGSSVTLFASNSIQIVQDGNPYIGNSSFGWSYSQWNFQTPSPAELAHINTNVGVPIIRDLVRFDYIKICGIASIDKKDIETLLEYNIYLFNCNDLTLALLGGGQQLFTTDSICFCHSILINEPIFTCDNFLVVEFTCTPGRNPGTICNISYSLYVPNLGNTGCSGTGGGAGS